MGCISCSAAAWPWRYTARPASKAHLTPLFPIWVNVISNARNIIVFASFCSPESWLGLKMDSDSDWSDLGSD
jgi:hypothetical protein